MRTSDIILAGLVLLSGGFFVYVFMSSKNIQTSSANMPQFEPQANGDGGVTITIQPADLSGKSGVWTFDVTVNTHSGDLGEDMAKASTLESMDGNAYPATVWEGDPPGGHHRRGILKFAPIPLRPERFSLVIRDVGGIRERKFTWTPPK